MIDLGVELAGYGRAPTATFSLAGLHDMRARVWTGGSGVNLGPLADLQAQGFNTEPPPGFPEFSDYRRGFFSALRSPQ